jgi:hypothetical protein
MQKKNGHIQLRFGPKWHFIAPARTFIQNFMGVTVTNKSKAESIAMAVSELMENAIKYGDAGEVEISVYSEGEEGLLVAEVSNQSHSESISDLQNSFKKVMAGDPLEAYIMMMRESATRDDGKSQLGLARIRYEANADIKLIVTPEDRVTIRLEVE